MVLGLGFKAYGSEFLGCRFRTSRWKKRARSYGQGVRSVAGGERQHPGRESKGGRGGGRRRAAHSGDERGCQNMERKEY